MLGLLSAVLQSQRRRGRTSAADAVRAVVIEESEADGLLAELERAWSGEADEAMPDAGFGAARAWVDALADDAAREGVQLPLHHVRNQFALGDDEYDALLLTLLVEHDSRAARLAGYLNDHASRQRPTVGLAAALAEVQGEVADPLRWCRRPMLTDGLLSLEGDGPLPERSLRIDHGQALRLISLDAVVEPSLRIGPPDRELLGQLVLADELPEGVSTWAHEVLRGEGTPIVIVAGPPGSGRSSLIRAAAGAAGRPLVEERHATGDFATRLQLLRREARWYGAAIAVRLASAADVHEFWAQVGAPPDLLFIEVDDDLIERVAVNAPSSPVLWRLKDPGIGTRAALWQRMAGPVSDISVADANALAAAFRFGPAAIRAVIRRATIAGGDTRPERSTFASAARAHVGSSLAALADRLPLVHDRSDLVLGEDINRELDLAVSWMLHQRTVLDTWGLGKRIATGRGLTALFAGPPGTGKTMAAQVLARQLDLDCYRVDLSRVVSKFIGETEKNLAQVFDEAEVGGAVLLFDEADALFGKRSEVKDSRDRYANLEVSYLLQRMESFDGVAVLATNRSTDIDEAFIRRFQITARFRLPTPDERRRIWRGLIPEAGATATTVDIDRVADSVELSGGEIKNCVLAAAYLAASEQRLIDVDHVVAAIRRELGKSGRLVDEAALSSLAPSPEEPRGLV